MRAGMLCSYSGSGWHSACISAFSLQDPWEWGGCCGGREHKAHLAVQIREGLPQVPGHSQPAGHRCVRRAWNPPALRTLLLARKPEALLVDWADGLLPTQPGILFLGLQKAKEESVLGERGVFLTWNVDVQLLRGSGGWGVGSAHSPRVLIFGEGRGNLLKWDHVTKVIKGFVSHCCLGNRNINQRFL